MNTNEVFSSGRLVEQWNGPAGTYTRWDADGNVMETRALTADELARLTPPPPQPVPAADALDSAADHAERHGQAQRQDGQLRGVGQGRRDQLTHRLEEVGTLMNQENATADMDQYRKLTREHAELEPVVALHAAWMQAQADMAEAQDMMADPEMKDFAQEEWNTARARVEQLEQLADRLAAHPLET